ncbi:MAG: LysM peptidoglycan-binding domain-containing protein [Microthrixaceae bacterium]
MAAVIELRTGRDLSDSSFSPARHTAPAPAPTPLRVIHGGRSLAARRMRRTFMLRRVAVAVAAVLLVWFGVQVVGAAFAPLPASGSPGVELGAVHRVAPGDTLWALASSVDPQTDPRDVVDQIVALNGPGSPGSALDDDLHLLAGRELRLPTDR